MWWIRDLTVTKGTTKDSPVTLEAGLTRGTIERVIIFFRPGCSGYVKATLWEKEHQFLPQDPLGYITGDDYVFDMIMNHELKDSPYNVEVRAWNTASTYDHTITVGIFVRETAVSRISRAVKSVLGLAGETLEIE